MFRATHAIVSLLACSTIGILAAGCEDDEKAIPQGIFEGNVQTGTNSTCKDSGEIFRAGEFGNAAAKKASVPVPDGQSFGQGTVNVSCSVTPSGTDEFAVDATISLSGAEGGLFKLEGKFKTTGDQTNIFVTASNRLRANTYTETDRGCIARYSEPGMAIAAGRVWASIDCPNAVIGGSDGTRSCRLTAQFRFENCNQ